ncbi:MAG TPA: MFS transporter [Candidatus Micrarchaeaceae archaeon]|nr:MFS transporter [Candidatus Micrarchaeaceae archaeon]
MAHVADGSSLNRSADPVILPKTALAGMAGTYLLIGALAASYGTLLEHLVRRFDITLPEAGAVFSAHFSGALVGVFALMWAMKRIHGRTAIWAALAALVVGCAGVALAPSWPAFLAAVFLIGLGFGGLDIGLNQLVAHSVGPRRSALINVLNSAYGFGSVAGPILISRLSQDHLTQLYGAAAALAAVLLPAVAGIRGRLPYVGQQSVRNGDARPRSRRLDALVVIFVVAFIFYVGVETGVGGWMPSDLEAVGFGSLDAASVTSGFWLALAIGRLLAALIPDRVPPRLVIISGAAVAVVALLVALNGHAAPIAFIVTGFVIAPIFPTALVWLAKLRPGDSRATSWMFPATMVGGGVIPPAIGVAIGWFGIAGAPAVLSAVAVVMLMAFLFAARTGRE